MAEQEQQARSQPAQPAGVTVVTAVSPTVRGANSGPRKRPGRGHAAASTRVVLAGASISATVVLMSFMGPFVKVGPDNADTVATAPGAASERKTLAELGREVAGGSPPFDAPPAPAWAHVILPPHLDVARVVSPPVAQVTVVAAATPAPPTAVTVSAAPTPTAAPAPLVAPAPAPAPAPPPPPRTSASG